MKCQFCKSEIDDDIIGLDEWNNCPLCGAPMFGFTDEMLDIAVEMLLRDVRTTEKRLMFLLSRLREVKQK